MDISCVPALPTSSPIALSRIRQHGGIQSKHHPRPSRVESASFSSHQPYLVGLTGIIQGLSRGREVDSIFNTMARYLPLLFLLKAWTADSAAWTTLFNCTNFTFPDDNVVTNLCYQVRVFTPNPCSTVLPNGTEIIFDVGGYAETYNFRNTREHEMEGFITRIAWEQGVTQDCVASVNDEECLKCTLCADGSTSADCTNFEQGRNVPCGEHYRSFWNGDVESYPPDPPFFPFLSTFDKEGGIYSLPAVSDDVIPTGAQITASESPTASPDARTSDPATEASAPSVSASEAASLQKGWLVTVGTAMLARVSVLI